MSGIGKRTNKKIPALAAMALMTALTGSLLPVERVQAAPSVKESNKPSNPRRANPSPSDQASAAELRSDLSASSFVNLSAKGDVGGMWKYIESRAASASQASVTVWLRRLESLQSKRLPSLEEELSREQVQEALMNTDGIYGDWKRGTRTGNAQADKLLVELENNGYVLDSTEGYFFPKIDYLRYMKQAKYTTTRYADYLTIRSDETKSELTKDAGLIVSWEELLKRAERQSLYLLRYPDSPEAEVVQMMYRQSLYIVLFGTDNVPLFDYETKQIDPDAKAAYQKQLKKGGQSPFAKMMRNYMRVLDQSGGKLTQSVETFREARNPWKEN